MSVLRPILLFALLLVAGGYANPWEQSFQQDPRYELRPLAEGKSIDVRTLEWQRWANYVASERDRRTVSSVADVDLPATQRAILEDKLLETIQLGSDRSAQVLGVSVFDGWGDSDPKRTKLRDFARDIGADTVVTTAGYLGHEDRVTHETVRTTVSGTGHYRRVNGKTEYVPSSGFESADSTVPVVVREAKFNYVAVFVRRGLIDAGR